MGYIVSLCDEGSVFLPRRTCVSFALGIHRWLLTAKKSWLLPMSLPVVALLVVQQGSAVSAEAQHEPLTLQQAVATALEQNPDRKMAATELITAAAEYRLSRTELLPQFSFGEGVTRSNDPVFAFGSKLRQQRFGQSDFGLNVLNRPTPVNDFETKFTGQWTVFDSWKTEYAIKQAFLVRQGAQQSLSRTDQELMFHVVTAYESVLASKRDSQVAQHALVTAKAVLDLSLSRVLAGTVSESDALAAEVNVATRQAELIRARGEESIAQAELNNAMGLPAQLGEGPIEELQPKVFVVASLETEITAAQQNRPDLRALGLQEQAQQAAVRGARSSFGPRVDTFGSWQLDKPALTGSGGISWAAGAELRIDILPAAKRERLALEKVGLERLDAGQISAQNTVRLEVSRAYYEHLAAEQTVMVTKAAVAQATESMRILQDRYDAGLATVADILRAEDAQRQTESNYWQSVYRNTVTFAALRLATGTLNPDQVANLK